MKRCIMNSYSHSGIAGCRIHDLDCCSEVIERWHVQGSEGDTHPRLHDPSLRSNDQFEIFGWGGEG